MARNVLSGKDGNNFSKDNQPSKEAQKKGMAKRKALKDICAQIVSGEAVDLLKPLALLIGVNPNEIDIETMMHLKQIEIAIKENDTKAYNAVMDRLKGKAPQQIDLNNNINDNRKSIAELFPTPKDIEETDK